MNLLQIYGRVGGPVQLRQVGQSVVASFSVATNHRFTKSTGDVIDNTTWHNVVIWGKLGQAVSEQIDKGTEVFVVGRQEHRSYEKKDGTKGYASELIADRVFVGLKPPMSAQKPAAPAAPPAQSALDLDPDGIPF